MDPATGALPARTWWAALAAAAAPAAAYVVIAPPSRDLAAQLYRTWLFAHTGFTLWDNGWYSGHHVPGYSVLFGAVASVLTPRLAAALAAVGTGVLFTRLVARHFGSRAGPGVILFGAATAIDLYTGRLTLALGALPALAAIDRLDRGRTATAAVLAGLASLCSPVAGLFTAVAAGGDAVGRRTAAGGRSGMTAGAVVAGAALVPIGLLALVVPEGGREPFGSTTLLPLLVICGGALWALGAGAPRLRAGVAIYAAISVAAFVIPSPLGANVARLGVALAAPVATLVWWRRRTRLLALVILPLLYVGFQAPVFDVAATAGDASVSAGYYRPLLRFLTRERARGGGIPFRVEIPFTAGHWEAYWVAGPGGFPLARGWERQLDIGDNALFYDTRLTPEAYDAWLHRHAVRFVAVADVALDPSARVEAAITGRPQPFLSPVWHSAHWRVYAVVDPTPLASGSATVTALGSDSLTLRARGRGSALVRVTFSPYWSLSGPAGAGGCVAPAPGGTRVTLRRPGVARLVISFAPGRVGARSPRCTGA